MGKMDLRWSNVIRGNLITLSRRGWMVEKIVHDVQNINCIESVLLSSSKSYQLIFFSYI